MSILSETASLPRYVEIEKSLEALIMSGTWRPGDRVPSEHELMRQYGCSRMTVNKALSRLANAGLVVRRRRSGSFVAMPTSEETVLEIHDVRTEVAKSGQSYDYELISRKLRPANREDAARLAVPGGTEVLALRCRHFAGGRPFLVEDRLIHLAAAPDARSESFAEALPGTWLLIRIPWTSAEHHICAVNADAAGARLLDVEPGAACLVVQRRTWQSGVPVTVVDLTYPGDRHRLVGRFKP